MVRRYQIASRIIIGIVLASVLSLAAFSPSYAATTILRPTSIVTTAGGRDCGNHTALAVQDQSGTQDNCTNYAEFSTPGATYAGYRTYSVPASINPTTITAIQVKANYRGPTKANQSWAWSIYNWSTNRWGALGDNAGASDWSSWVLLTFNAAGTFANYVSVGREIRIQVVSNNAADNMLLDYEAVVLTTSGTSATATRTRTPTNTPVATFQPPTNTRTATFTPTATRTSTPVPPTATATGGYWVPPLRVSWQWQLTFDAGQSNINMNIPADVYDIDGFDNDAADVAQLKALRPGRRVICYISVGSWEAWRPDAGSFPQSVRGNTLDGWPDEKWLDVRQTSILIPIMRARFQMCKDKGFDAIEPDNLDAYSNNSGFNISQTDQIAYLRLLADEAHALGLSIGLKNAVDIADRAAQYFDWALNEQCYEYNECGYLTTYFVNRGKAAFVVEYTLPKSNWCSLANMANYNGLKKPDNYILTSEWEPCR